MPPRVLLTGLALGRVDDSFSFHLKELNELAPATIGQIRTPFAMSVGNLKFLFRRMAKLQCFQLVADFDLIE